MEEVVKQLQQTYAKEIASITVVGKAEINITIVDRVHAESFSLKLQNHVVSVIDELEIVKINIVDTKGVTIDSFATNQ